MEWNRTSNLDVAIEMLVAAAGRCPATDDFTLPFQLGGHSETDLKKQESRSSKAIPIEIRKLFGTIQGIPFPQTMRPCLFVLELSETGWIDNAAEPEIAWLKDEWPDWYSKRYFEFGRGIFGDRVAFCEGGQGQIVLLGHEGLGPDDSALQPPTITILADNLSEWLCRWIAFDFEEYGYIPGEIPNLPADLGAEFLADHRRLNPGINC